MKRFVFAAVAVLCFASQSTVLAQGDIFNRLKQELGSQLQRELGQIRQPPRQRFPGGQQPGGQQPQYQGHRMPSEGGPGSGGGRDRFNPNDGNDFLFPGDGGGGVFPGNGGGFPGDGGGFPGNGNPGNVYPGNGGYPNNGQPYIQPQQGQYIYPGGQIVNPGQSQNWQSSSAISGLPSSPVNSNQYVLIRCPDGTAGNISYTLSSSSGNFSFSMRAGQEQRFRVNTPWSISYNDGSQQRRYKLEGGKTYTIKRKSDNLWQLYAAK